MNRRAYSEWEPRSLASLGTYLNGFAFKPQHWGENGLPIVRIRELLDPTVEPDRYEGPTADPYLIEDGDLIFSWSATLAVVFWNRGPAYLNQHLFKVTPAPDVNVRFLHHLINYHLDRLAAKSHGTTMKHVTRGDLDRYLIRLPGLDEQGAIAELLDTLDCQIRISNELVKKLRLQANGLVDDLVAAIPAEQREPLAHLCVADICYGIVQSGEFVAGGVPVLSIRDLSGDFETELHRTKPAIDAQYRRSRVAPGDVLLSIKGTIGRVGVAPEHYTGNISRELARLRFGKNILPEFARLYLLSREAQRRLDLAVVGTTRAELSIHVLKKFGFPAPSPECQQRMVAVYRSIERRIVAEEKEREKLRTLKLGLASDLLTGRVRVPAVVSS